VEGGEDGGGRSPRVRCSEGGAYNQPALELGGANKKKVIAFEHRNYSLGKKAQVHLHPLSEIEGGRATQRPLTPNLLRSQNLWEDVVIKKNGG